MTALLDDVRVDAGPRRKLQRIATALFATKGYEATSMRDIAAAAGLMPGSLYSHFTSKEDLFISISQASVNRVHDEVCAAIEGVTGGKARFEAAVIAHVEALLVRDEARGRVVLLFPPSITPEGREMLVAIRQPYEALFAQLVKGLELPPAIDHNLYRKVVLSMLNTLPIWYRPEGEASARDIAQLVLFMLHR